MLERLCRANYPKILLQTQHRMPKEISDLASELFYEGKIQTHENKTINQQEFPIRLIPSNYPERKHASSSSYANDGEIELLIQETNELLKKGVSPDDIGILTPYVSQRDLAREIFADHQLPIEIANIDAFQGREKKFILFSAVRSNARGAVGFLSDWRRVNVAITRAKNGLTIIGDQHTLNQNPLWNKILNWIQIKKSNWIEQKTTPSTTIQTN